MAQDAIIRKINPYELHGVLYYQMLLSYTDTPGMVTEVRLAHDVVYSSPTEGDLVSVEKLLSIVTAVTKREP